MDPSSASAAIERKHPDAHLVEVLFRDLEDVGAWRVYADWLSERGDPHGELVRVHLSEPVDRAREKAIIDANFEAWLGRFADGTVAPHWERGFVEAMSLRPEPKNPVRGFGELAAVPCLRFVRRIDAAYLACSASGLDRFGGLERLTLGRGIARHLDSLPGLSLRRLKTLRFEPWRGPAEVVGPDAIEALAAIDAPALQRFELWRAGQPLIDAALDLLLTGRWASRLSGVTLGPIPADLADGVLEKLAPLISRGTVVYLLVTGSAHETPTLERWRQAVYPTVRLSPAYERSGFCGSTPFLSETPGYAPYDFRDLPPRVEAKPGSHSSSGKSALPVHHGSGWPLDEHEKVRRCLGCGARDVLQIYDRYVTHSGSTTTDSYADAELVCRECGRFTRWEYTTGH